MLGQSARDYESERSRSQWTIGLLVEIGRVFGTGQGNSGTSCSPCSDCFGRGERRLFRELLLCFYSYIITYLMLPSFSDMLLRGGFVAENYQGNRLPVGMGIIIIAGAGLSLLSTLPFYWLQWEREGLAFLFLLTAIGLLG